MIGAQGVAMRDVRSTKKAALTVDVGCLFDDEALLPSGEITLHAPPTSDPDDEPEVRADAERRYKFWEQLRKLSAKAAVESHAKEVFYAGPLLHGFRRKTRGRILEPVLAPLWVQGVTLQVTSDGAVTVRAQDESPRFNTSIWRETVSEADAKQIVDLGLGAQADLAGGYSPERVATLLEGITSIAPFVSSEPPTGVLEPWPVLPERGSFPDQPELRLRNGAVLFLANRASPYLLHDLEAIAAAPGDVLEAGRPLSVMVNPPATKLQPEAGEIALDEVIYPFPSNGAQRQVADVLEKNQLVVVQGPPGNGKSLTIANLVAHLVANGKRVLVSSHKNQALTVVRDKLAESRLRFLYASMVGEGVAAKRELQRQIANVKAFAGNASKAALKKQLSALEEQRRESGERYRQLRQEFIDRAEPEQEEAARLFEGFRDVSILPVDDAPLSEAEQPAAAAALRELDEISRTHAVVWRELRIGDLGGSGDVAAPLQKLSGFIDQQEARLAAAADERVHELVRQWHATTDGDPSQIQLCRDVIGSIRADLAPYLVAHEARDAATKLADAPSLLSDVARSAEQIDVAFSASRQLAEHRLTLSVSPDLRSQIRDQYLQARSVNPIKRWAARRWLDEHAPGSAALSLDQLEKWSDFWDVWSKLRALCSGLSGGLAVQLTGAYDPDGAQAALVRAQWASRYAAVIGQVRAHAARTSVPLPLEKLLAAESVTALDAVLTPCQQALAALDADRAGNEYKIDADLDFLRGSPAKVDALIDEAKHEEAEELLAHLRSVCDALPSLARRRQLLDGPLDHLPAASEQVEASAEQGDPPPGFLREVERALAVHADAVRFYELAGGATTRALAEEISRLTEQLMGDARELLGARIQERILEGFRSPSFLSSLEMFRKAVGGSPKRFERFEELKSSPNFDVDVLTEVFPCWIMRPEDVCRVFPMRSDLFDVLIIDEASQCNPDQTLPLFARAKSVAVFGDDKQLSNEDIKRALSTNANRSLLKQSGLDALDPGGLFDQTRHSLLELASRRQQASVLLNEHFRCRPEIIAFSNDRFYGNTLRVIRDRQDDRGVGPAVLVRQVELSESLPTAKGAKVNHAEAEALIEELTRRLADDRYADMSFGVLSLFREQVQYLETMIENQVPLEQKERHRLICSTVDGFQGDERDVILYSWRFNASDHPALFAFTNGGAGEQRTNVALTRARHQAIHFISVPVERFPKSAANVSGFLEHAAAPERLLEKIEARTHNEPSGRAREQLRQALEDKELEVVDDYVACGISVDLLVHDRETRRRVAVFVDADRAPHRPADTPQRIDQHSLLERSGWTVIRVPATENLVELERSTETVIDSLMASPELSEQGQEELQHAVIRMDAVSIPVPEGDLLDPEVSPEDRADYHWDVPSVEARLSAGEAVFMSDFERQLYDMLATTGDLRVVPQWPSRGKFIDLVLTDREGRRLAVEADGSQHHETPQGRLVPEDLERQSLLEEAGWTFARVAHRDFVSDPDRVIETLRGRLAEQPSNDLLAEAVWGDGTPSNRDPEVALTLEPNQLTVGSEEEPAASTYRGAEATPEPVTVPTSNPPENPSVSPSAATAQDGSEPVPKARGVTEFDDMPLGLISATVWSVVSHYGEVHDDDLADRFAEHTGVAIASRRRKMLTRFAWSAKGRGFLELDEATKIWTTTQNGPKRPAPADERYGEWTFNMLRLRAAQLLCHEEDPFEALLHELYDAPRVPRLAARIAGSAIYEAREAAGSQPG